MLSKNGAALIVIALSYLGIEAMENDIVNVISAVAQIVSFGVMILNQLGRRDVVGFIFKK